MGTESCNVVATTVLNKANFINHFCKQCRANCHLKQLSSLTGIALGSC